jgi:hypothetical protein
MKEIKMLTKEVINAVNVIDTITERMAQLGRTRDSLFTDIKNLILKADPYCGLDYLEVTSLSIVDSPIGQQQENGSFASEHCEDSLLMPDSGYGLVCWPIEGGKWLKVDYIW